MRVPCAPENLNSIKINVGTVWFCSELCGKDMFKLDSISLQPKVSVLPETHSSLTLFMLLFSILCS